MRDGILDQTYISGLEGTLRTNVGVYFCGPNVAARDIKSACKSVRTEEVNFSFWKEQYVTITPIMLFIKVIVSCANMLFNQSLVSKRFFSLFFTRCSILF